MSTAAGSQLGMLLLAVLGIDHKNVTGIDISIRAGSMACVDIHRAITVGESQKLVSEVSKFRLVPVDTGEGRAS